MEHLTRIAAGLFGLSLALASCSDESTSGPSPSTSTSSSQSGAGGAGGAGGHGGDGGLGAGGGPGEGGSAGQGGGGRASGAPELPPCSYQQETGTTVAAAETSAGAADAAIAPDATPYNVALPAAGSGFISFDISHEHTTFAIYTRSEDVVAITRGGADVTPTPDQLACNDGVLRRYEIHTHTPGTFIAELTAATADSFWLMLQIL